jgi:predicted SnoaL-like aldol condensation-catalyzing enzyme
MSKLEKNKSNAQAFYELMFNQCKPRDAIEQFVGDEHIQHNPEVADGKEGFIDYFERMAVEYPGEEVHFKRAVAEEDLVVLHCHQLGPQFTTFDGSSRIRNAEHLHCLLTACCQEACVIVDQYLRFLTGAQSETLLPSNEPGSHYPLDAH